MTYRKHPIFTEQIYHVYNRGIAKEPIFFDKKDYLRFIEVINFYHFSSPSLRFSYYNRLELESRSHFLNELEKNADRLVNIFSFCLIPNHYHFVLKEVEQKGISKFISNLQNSYAKYFNTKNKRSGSLFQEMFKAVRIESDEQLLHTVRYIHLNPWTSFLVKELNQLKNYPWSSLQSYLEFNSFPFLQTELILSFFKTNEKFSSFTFDQADYQRKLGEIKHLMFD
ncbi:transposase [Candidatus Gottesmanbacteria bacterium]|nr:transposase [Candidatus Gottesmanbacteria bacterium]